MADIHAQPTDYSGIWYGNQPTDPPYYWKYSGALATYPQQHLPIAIHRRDVQRTYFVYGGAGVKPAGHDYDPAGREVPGTTDCCISYFDHRTGKCVTPRVVLTRDIIDAHENPTLCIDETGHLLMFCPSHGPRRTATILRSDKPNDIVHWNVVTEFGQADNFSYPQPWWIPDHGVVLLHTRYQDGKRRLCVANSPDGLDWSAWPGRQTVIAIDQGNYQISWPREDGTLVTAFDMHPKTQGDHPLNRRCNLYIMQSHDGGQSWMTMNQESLSLPLREEANPARVLDTRDDGRLVYLKDLMFDQNDRTVVLYMTSRSAWPGPEGGPHQWWFARHDPDGTWSHHHITDSDHCYDHGSLYRTPEGSWRLLTPSDPGPQRFATGGALGLWVSSDNGTTWHLEQHVASDDPDNHTYVRRPLHATDDFAWLWASGNSHKPGQTQLWYADASGQMARTMKI